MVLKRSKLGRWTGNSFKSYCYHRQLHEHGCVSKCLPDPRSISDTEREAIADISADLISDGDIPKCRIYGSVRSRWRSCETYSLNKHKRWLLPDLITSKIKEGDLDEENFQVVLHEHLAKKVVTRKSHLSEEETKIKTKKKRKSHNQHGRGVQRKLQKSVPDIVEEEEEEGDETLPEVRYEVWYDYLIRKCKKYRGLEYHHGIFYGNEPKFWKTKGGRNKPWAQIFYKGISCIDKKHYIKYKGEREEDDFTEDTHTVEGSSPKTRSKAPLELSDFIVAGGVDHLPKRRVRKRKHPNTATSDSVFYGKDMVIYLTKETAADVNADDENAVMMEDNEQALNEYQSTLTALPDFSLTENRILCKIDVRSIQDFTANYPNICSISLNCMPCRFGIALEGTPTSSEIILWQKGSLTDVGFYINEYWMKLNLRTGCRQEEIHALNDQLRNTLHSSNVYTVDGVIGAAQDILSQFQCSNTRPPSVPPPLEESVLQKICGSRFDVKTIQDAYQLLESQDQTEALQDDILESFEMVPSYDTPSIDLEFPYCDICFSDIDDPVAQGTLLLPCRHYFCNNCWSLYIMEKVRSGRNTINCQVYKCESVLEDIAVKSLIPCELYNDWLRRRKENILECSKTWKWCPNAKCKRVARIIKTGKCAENVSVRCSCNTTWCFSCQKDRHWPASCQQRGVYTKMLRQNGDEFGSAMSTTVTYYVDVKKCPKCAHPIEKNGGCQCMYCRCEHRFCWECLEDWSSHVNNGLICVKRRVPEITMELENTKTFPLPVRFYKQSVQHRYKHLKFLSRTSIASRCRKYALRVQRKKMKKLKDLNTLRLLDEEAYSNMMHFINLIKEVHEILENVLVLMSNLTKRTRCRFMENLINQLQFSVDRLEEILKTEEVKLTGMLNQKAFALESAMYKVMEQMSQNVSWVQNIISKSSKQKILEQPISSLENFR